MISKLWHDYSKAFESPEESPPVFLNQAQLRDLAKRMANEHNAKVRNGRVKKSS